ncbi:11753_t:CDS:2, partial [Scutellospora calospora]
MRIWAISCYSVEREDYKIEMIIFVPANMYERDLETQAVFKKDKFYCIGGKIVPNNYEKDKKVKIAVSISMHLTIFDKISASNKCPLKVALIGILQEMLQEVKNSENAIIQTFITDYIFGEEYTCFESKKRYSDNMTTQITSTPKNSIRSKLFVTHQNVLENTNKKFENEDLPSVNSDNFHDSFGSTSLTDSQLLKYVQVENISIEQTNQEFNEKNDLADHDQEKYKEMTNKIIKKITKIIMKK